MKKFTILALLLISCFIFKGQAKYYLTNNAGEPYGSPTNVNLMNSTFGVGNWTKVFFQTVSPAALFSPTTCFIYTDGSSQSADELDTFLVANITALQNWVGAGGRFVLNAAPNEGANINLGFGGITLNYATGPYSPSVTAVAGMTNHPIFTGPATPTGTMFTGNWASHGTISGGTPTAIVTGTAGTVLVELNYGTGKAMLSCINTANWLSPTPNAVNFKSNILSYISIGCGNVGLSKLSESINGLSVYPNPNKGIFVIELNNDLEKIIEITDVCGRLIRSMTSSEQKIDLDIRSQHPGIYFIKIKNDNNIRISKLIKE